MVLEAIKENQTINELAQKYELAPTQISKWKKEFLVGAELVFDQGPASAKSEAEMEREHLLKVIGELKVENDFLKKSLR